METDVIFPQKGHFADDGLIIVLPLSIARDALLSQLNNYIKGGKVQASLFLPANYEKGKPAPEWLKHGVPRLQQEHRPHVAVHVARVRAEVDIRHARRRVAYQASTLRGQQRDVRAGECGVADVAEAPVRQIGEQANS